jgi:hypothetical protein
MYSPDELKKKRRAEAGKKRHEGKRAKKSAGQEAVRKG